ncbi:MAG: MmgE/PrpD family protein [Actinobacteria bacterium]|nr:MmgE/PrpD family protein [Actinomycetota bacterium]
MTVLEDVARWVSGLSYDDIPPRVLEVARNQVASVLGAIHAGAGCAGGKAVIRTVDGLSGEGPCATYPGGGRTTFYSALLQNCSLSVALDYDDYLFLGHTGHSAVLAPLAVGEMRGADTRTVLVAQVAANEVAGRLGGTVAVGPHNGQMWAHIHLLGAAAAASRVLGLDPDMTADAMGIALAGPVYPLFPAFMGPQSKLLIATVPTLTGTVAAFLAEGGMSGPRGILEDPQGFWANFSFVPMPFMLTGFGRAWVTDTVAFKPYPGCAYIDTAMDALFEITGEFRERKGRDIEPEEVLGIEAEASLLTCAMDAMSSGYLDPEKLSPTNINFSLALSVAIGLIAGTLSGAELTDGFLTSNRERILALASRVELRHCAGMTVAFVRALDRVVDLKAMLREIDLRTLLKVRRRLREHLSSVATMGPGEAIAAWRSLSPEDRAFLRGLMSIGDLFKAHPSYDLGPSRFEELEMPFGARLSVRLKDGTTLEAERLIPRGAPGDRARLDVPREKFVKETAPFIGWEAAEAAVDTVLDLENRTLDDMREAVARGE